MRERERPMSAFFAPCYRLPLTLYFAVIFTSATFKYIIISPITLPTKSIVFKIVRYICTMLTFYIEYLHNTVLTFILVTC